MTTEKALSKRGKMIGYIKQRAQSMEEVEESTPRALPADRRRVSVGFASSAWGAQGDIDRIASICAMVADLRREGFGLEIDMGYSWVELYEMAAGRTEWGWPHGLGASGHWPCED